MVGQQLLHGAQRLRWQRPGKQLAGGEVDGGYPRSSLPNRDVRPPVRLVEVQVQGVSVRPAVRGPVQSSPLVGRRWLLGRVQVSQRLAARDAARAVRARAVLEAITLVELTPAVCEQAGRLDPPELGSLDALHLAAALSPGDDLEGLVTYDERQGLVAESLGVPVVAPG